MALYDGISKKLFSRTTSKVALLILVLFSVVRLLMLVTLKDQFEFNFNVAFGIRSRVDLRILLMTYARPNSLHTCLNNLDLLKFENSSTTRSLDIWIDRDRLGITNTHRKFTKSIDNYFLCYILHLYYIYATFYDLQYRFYNVVAIIYIIKYRSYSIIYNNISNSKKNICTYLDNCSF